MTNIEKSIRQIELDNYIKETAEELAHIAGAKIEKDLPGVRISIAVKVELAILDNLPRKS